MQWDNLSPKERKLVIVKDVLGQIRLNKLIVKEMSYVRGNFEHPESGTITQHDIEAMRARCQVCAKGALFLSRVDKFNSVDWKDVGTRLYRLARNGLDIDNESCVRSLDGAFTERELDLIEIAFERHDANGLWDEGVDQHEIDKHITWGQQFDDPTVRLEQICKNILDNDGEFVV